MSLTLNANVKGVSEISSPDARMESRLSWLRVFLVFVTVVQSDDIWATLAGLNVVNIRWMFAAIYAVCAVLAFTRPFRAITFFLYPAMAIAAFIAISSISATFIFQVSPSLWLTSVYSFFPLLIFYLFYNFRVSIKEVAVGIVLASLFACILIAGDRLIGLGIEAAFRRRSTFGVEIYRIVLLKNEVVFSSLYIATCMIHEKRKLVLAKLSICFTILLFCLSVFMQTRLGILAVAVGICTSFLLFPPISSLRRWLILFLSIFIVAPLAYLAISPYIDSVSAAGFEDSDGALNVAVRFDTVGYYWDEFVRAGMIGLGSVSSEAASHPISVGLRNQLNISDAGAYQALLQFGIPGLLIFLSFNFAVLRSLYMYAKGRAVRPREVIAFLSFSVAFLASPLPLSFYTQAWTIHLGGILLYVAYVANRTRVT